MDQALPERKVAYPTQPWLWNPEWTQGRILHADRPGTIRGSIIGHRIVGAVVLMCAAYLISLFGDVSLALETNPALLGGKLRAAAVSGIIVPASPPAQGSDPASRAFL